MLNDDILLEILHVLIAVLFYNEYRVNRLQYKVFRTSPHCVCDPVDFRIKPPSSTLMYYF